MPYAIHFWKEVAPLKLFSLGHIPSVFANYPFLKRSGSIETIYVLNAPITPAIVVYPFLKRSGSIETILNNTTSGPLFCSIHFWKEVAPLKLKLVGVIRNASYGLSISEMKWLHWNRITAIIIINKARTYPFLKRSGSIETLYPKAFLGWRLALSISEKKWLHWNRHACLGTHEAWKWVKAWKRYQRYESHRGEVAPICVSPIFISNVLHRWIYG